MNPLENTVEILNELRNQQIETIGALPFFLVLLLSLASALLVAVLYRRFFAERETGSQIHRSFGLLGVSITAIFICIQFSLPLSLGLLGALSIVRFRTPIKEPEEIGFLMVVIATSLAAATFNFVFLGIVLVLALVAVLARELAPGLLGGGSQNGLLLVTLGEGDYAEKRDQILTLLDEGVRGGRLESVTRNGDAVSLTFSFRRLASNQLAEIDARLQSVVAARQFAVSYDRFGA